MIQYILMIGLIVFLIFVFLLLLNRIFGGIFPNIGEMMTNFKEGVFFPFKATKELAWKPIDLAKSGTSKIQEGVSWALRGFKPKTEMKYEETDIVLPSGEVVNTTIRGETQEERQQYAQKEAVRIQQLLDQDRGTLTTQEKREAGLIDVGFIVDATREKAYRDSSGQWYPSGRT